MLIKCLGQKGRAGNFTWYSKSKRNELEIWTYCEKVSYNEIRILWDVQRIPFQNVRPGPLAVNIGINHAVISNAVQIVTWIFHWGGGYFNGKSMTIPLTWLWLNYFTFLPHYTQNKNIVQRSFWSLLQFIALENAMGTSSFPLHFPQHTEQCTGHFNIPNWNLMPSPVRHLRRDPDDVRSISSDMDQFQIGSCQLQRQVGVVPTSGA